MSRTRKTATSAAANIEENGTKKKSKTQLKPEAADVCKPAGKGQQKRKRNGATQLGEEPVSIRKMLKRAAACDNFKEKSVNVPEEDSIIESRKDHKVEEEEVAVHLTHGEGPEDGHPCRRLTDFVFHDSEGNPMSLETLEVDELFISGLILPIEESSNKEKEKGYRCDGFGRIETWAISGYEDGSPVIWVSTDVADFDCVKPATGYKRFHDLFFAKALACIEVYKILSKSSGGNPDTSLDELLARSVRSMSGSKCLSGVDIKDFVISQGEFISNQLIGLDETSKKTDQIFAELPALIALKDESNRHVKFLKPTEASSGGSLMIGSNGGSKINEDADDVKLAKILQDEEYWRSMKLRKNQHSTSNSSLAKFYIKINEDEIANDYPLPAYYKPCESETDEYVVFDSDIMWDVSELPLNMLHNWSLYNSDSRLVSLELLPMKPCADIDVTIYGSGSMTNDDGSGFCLDSDPSMTSSGSGGQNSGGMPIYLSAIKEWMIEFGSSMVFISIRTDMSWYRLGTPSKQYAPWYKTVLKTARLAINIIATLKEQTRIARLSFPDVIKKVAEFQQKDPAFISSNPVAVERYVVVHGQIILQLFNVYPDREIKNCAFVSGLKQKMEEKHHTKWTLKKTKKIERMCQPNLNPRAAMEPIVSKRKLMQATTTRLINRIWGDYYSNYLPEDLKEELSCEVKEEEDIEEEAEEQENEENENEEEKSLVSKETQKCSLVSTRNNQSSESNEIKWDGESVGKTCSGEPLYKQAIVRGDLIAVGTSVQIDDDGSDMPSPIYFVEFMFETSDGNKMFHGRKLQRALETVLGNTANEREVFLTNECLEFELAGVQTVVVEIRLMPWGHQHRNENAILDKADRAKAEERKKKGLPIEYYCKSLYWPERGAFFSLPCESLGLGSGYCHSCKTKEAQKDKEMFKINSSKAGFFYQGTEYSIHDFVYVASHHFSTEKVGNETYKGGRNVGLKAYVVSQLLDVTVSKATKEPTVNNTQVKVRRFFRPEDVSADKAYCSDIREVYYSEEIHVLSVETIEGRCEVRKKHELPSFNYPGIFQHVFFCERLYDPSKGSLKQLPPQVKLNYSSERAIDVSAGWKKKGKSKEGEYTSTLEEKTEDNQQNRLATLDIFSGCGGLSEGLQQSGVSSTKWAIEYEEPAGEAFKLNHPESTVFIKNCNVMLRAIMEKCGDIDDCISTSDAAELAASLSEKEIQDLPLPGQVDFINGGPPCQGFSGMNRFNQSTWSRVQCEMILAFLSFADYFRPKFFLLENVRNFVSFNKGQTFRLTLASLLEMGYQVRFGILEAGAYGVSQSRKRAFIWAASPEETLPEWPEPLHVFSGPSLKIALSETEQYTAVRSTTSGAPFRAITVRDTIADLPAVSNGTSKITSEYQNEACSTFQKIIRGNNLVLTEHISKEMNELNLIRCQKIPKRPGADWRDLPDEKVVLSTGQVVELIPWCLPNTAKRHNQWKGLFGRLDWEGNFPTSITDPQPMGKVGMCFHPDQDRILTVRECARSQGFHDSYQFFGNIHHKHRQIGNAVPPPLSFALGRKLKEALDRRSTR